MALAHPLLAGNAPLSAAANSPAMRQGESSNGVAVLQAALIDLGYPMPVSTNKSGLPDGIYGSETAAAVLKFQTKEKLKGRDGIAGKDTFHRIDRLLLTKIPPKPSPPPPAPTPPSTPEYMIGTADPPIKPDPGAGVWNSSPWTVSTYLQWDFIVKALPVAYGVIGDDATKHMFHYLMNTGSVYTIDLVGMIAEVPSAKPRYDAEVAQAKMFVEMLPEGTFNIVSKQLEQAYNTKPQSHNWYFAVGGYSTWGKGRATVVKIGSTRQFRLEFEYKFYDRYNWDKNKSVTFAGIKVTDQFMGEFHRQGMAKEFDMVGSVKETYLWTK